MTPANHLTAADTARFARNWDEALSIYQATLPTVDGWAAVLVQDQITRISAQIAFEAAIVAFDTLRHDTTRPVGDADGAEARAALTAIWLSNGCSADNGQAICWAVDAVLRHIPDAL